MAPASAQDLPQRAPQVCSHCKSIKKGCDKKLPSCSQCIKRRAVCRYGEHPEPRRYGDEVANAGRNIGINGPVSTWTSIPRSVLGRLNPGIRLSILLMNSISDVLHSDALGTKSTQSTTSIDSIINLQVCHIIRAGGESVEGVISSHFSGVHKWLPIISMKRFYDRFHFSQLPPTADFSILLLAMRLIAQHTSSDSDEDQDREILYLATKTLFTQVQTFIPSSMCLVQAAVIIARYEHAHGMIEAAYTSIGTSSRLASVIGIDNAQCSQELQGSDAWFDEEEALATWWGLVICDRIISSDIRMTGRPLAARAIRDDDYLPLEAAELAGDINYSITPTFRYFVSTNAISLPGIGPFSFEAQSTYLLDKVKTFVDSMDCDDQMLINLGRELQTALAFITEKVACEVKGYCGATETLVVGLYLLHQSAFTALNSKYQPDSGRMIRVTLDTITRMIIDIVYVLNKKIGICDIAALSPKFQHIVRCAQEHIMKCDDFHNPKWRQDLEELKKLLMYYNRRWTLAGQELHFLNKMVEMSSGM